MGRGPLRHTLYLEELTHQLAVDWTPYRRQRWPASTHPHEVATLITPAGRLLDLARRRWVRGKREG